MGAVVCQCFRIHGHEVDRLSFVGNVRMLQDHCIPKGQGLKEDNRLACQVRSVERELDFRAAVCRYRRKAGQHIYPIKGSAVRYRSVFRCIPDMGRAL